MKHNPRQAFLATDVVRSGLYFVTSRSRQLPVVLHVIRPNELTLQLHLGEYHFSSFSLPKQTFLKSLRRMSANRRFYIGKSKQFPFIGEINWSKRTFIAPVKTMSSHRCLCICFQPRFVSLILSCFCCFSWFSTTTNCFGHLFMTLLDIF